MVAVSAEPTAGSDSGLITGEGGVEPIQPDQDWPFRFRRRVVLTDAAIAALAIFLAHVARFGLLPTEVSGASWLGYSVVSIILFDLWMASLMMTGAWHHQIVGSGSLEYTRVFRATFGLFSLLAIGAFLARLDLGRGYIAIALPVGLIALLMGRASWGAWLRSQRRRGDMLHRTIVVGSSQSALDLADELAMQPTGGFEVVGLCVPGGALAHDEVDRHEVSAASFPVLGDLKDVVDVAERLGVGTIAVTKSDAVPPKRVRKLAWQLESSDIELILVPMMTDIAGPRIHEEPVPGLPLVRVQKPSLRRGQMWLKTAFDFCFSAAALIILSPLFILVAVAIKIDDGGPVFFRQVRIGRGEKPFKVWKFRSMRVDAEHLKVPEQVRAGQIDEVFFKATHDSRVTRVGRLLRRSSLDELPQIFNVLAQDMSLVGPRPLVPEEGAQIEGFVERRALVRPGITGLWQVSGRSEVSGEQRIRLDLLYVEQWSFAGDIAILLRTLAAVFNRRGAR